MGPADDGEANDLLAGASPPSLHLPPPAAEPPSQDTIRLSFMLFKNKFDGLSFSIFNSVAKEPVECHVSRSPPCESWKR